MVQFDKIDESDRIWLKNDNFIVLYFTFVISIGLNCKKTSIIVRLTRYEKLIKLYDGIRQHDFYRDSRDLFRDSSSWRDHAYLYLSGVSNKSVCLNRAEVGYLSRVILHLLYFQFLVVLLNKFVVEMAEINDKICTLIRVNLKKSGLMFGHLKPDLSL